MNSVLRTIILVSAFGGMGALLLRDGFIKWKRLRTSDPNKLKELILSPGIAMEIFCGAICVFFAILQIFIVVF
jgi:hypothetical protein